MTSSHAESIADAVQAHGTTHVFCLMGDGNMHVMPPIAQRGVEIVQVRHEGAAVAMAEGYSWASGRVGVASVTHGPGLTHTATSLVVASRSRTPLVLLAGETPEGAQHIDQARFVEACEAVYRPVTAGDDAGMVVADAYREAAAHRVPVVVGMPSRLVRQPVPADPHGPRATPPVATVSQADNVEAAGAIFDALAAARRPVLLAGRGALESDSGPVIARLAEVLGAALATTLPAKGLFDGHPHEIGISGGLAHPEGERILASADLVVALGSSAGFLTTRMGTMFPDAVLLRLDNRASGAGPGAGENFVLGEARATMELVLERLERAGIHHDRWFTSVSPWPECWREELEGFRPPLSVGTLDPRRAVLDIDPLLPDDAICVIANGHASGFASALLRGGHPRSTYYAQGFASIGQGLTTAIGVALGAPGRRVVVFEGDAGFMMHAQEVETAVRAGVRLTAFVLNDEAFGSEYHRLRDEASKELAVVPARGITPLVNAVGALGILVLENADVSAAAERALAAPLAVVELRVSRTVVSRHERWSHPGPESTAST